MRNRVASRWRKPNDTTRFIDGKGKANGVSAETKPEVKALEAKENVKLPETRPEVQVPENKEGKTQTPQSEGAQIIQIDDDEKDTSI